MTEYNFSAQYLQKPQPPAGNIVKRDWLKFYAPEELPEKFDAIVQSWDTAVSESEIAAFSACTTWGVKDRKAYLLDVFRKQLSFPPLKRAIEAHAALHQATIVLVEDKSSGSSLIQQLRADGFSIVRAAPALEGSKIMRLYGQTPMFEGGFVLLPRSADWLEIYLSELLSFPSSSYNDQVDSTVYALAWLAENPHPSGAIIKRDSIHYYTDLPEDRRYERVFMAWDTALKDGGQDDWTVCTVWSLIEGAYYLRHMERGIYGYSKLQQIFSELQKEYRPFKILIEETTTGKALKKDIKLSGSFLIRLVEIEPDRKGRVYVLQSMFEAGLVRFPKDAPFMRAVESELLSYPHGQTDDIVDSIALALTVGGSGYDSSMRWV